MVLAFNIQILSDTHEPGQVAAITQNFSSFTNKCRRMKMKKAADTIRVFQEKCYADINVKI